MYIALPATLLMLGFLGSAATPALPARARQRQAERTPPAAAEGQQIFVSNCAGCHGLDGQGSVRAPNIATGRAAQRLSDADLARIIQTGIPDTGMPAFTSLTQAEIETVAKYLRTLQGGPGTSALPGSPSAGKALFFGRAGCSDCHMLGGKGGFIASDLSPYGRAHSIDEIRSAIVMPDQSAGGRGKTVVVVLRDGKKLSGIARNEDNFTLQLQTLDGAFRFLQKSELEGLEYQPKSLMPGDYASKLSRRELDDLVSYLASTAGTVDHSASQGDGAEADKDE